MPVQLRRRARDESGSAAQQTLAVSRGGQPVQPPELPSVQEQDAPPAKRKKAKSDTNQIKTAFMQVLRVKLNIPPGDYVAKLDAYAVRIGRPTSKSSQVRVMEKHCPRTRSA